MVPVATVANDLSLAAERPVHRPRQSDREAVHAAAGPAAVAPPEPPIRRTASGAPGLE